MRRIFGIRFVICLMTAATLLTGRWASAADDAVAQEIKANTPTAITELQKIEVDLKKANLVSVKKIINGKVSQKRNLLKIPGLVTFNPKKRTISIPEIGLYKLELNYKGKSGEVVNDEIQIKVLEGDAPAPAAAVADADSDEEDPQSENEPTGGSLSGGVEDLASLRQKFPANNTQAEIKNYVVQLANSWATSSGKKGTVNGVASIDLTPADTCSKIAKILRDIERDLGSGRTPFSGLRDDVTKRFQTFYTTGGTSRFDLTNPYEDDWRPFLQRLLSDIDGKIAAAGMSKNVAFHRLVLLEVADGFDELRDEALGVTSGASGPQARSGTMSGSGYSSDECDRCRRRRRCRCSSLLFR